jgi:DNA-binding transcriptional LysR family regulator
MKAPRNTSLRFDLVDLHLFLCIAEAASITHGGARANMALASASERVRAMEDALGAPLLERQPRGVRLTPAGSALVHHARLVTQQLEQMRGELNDFAKGLRGNVRVLANTVAMTELLPVPLAAFLSAHPNIDVALEDRPSRDIVTTVGEGHADIGVITDAADLAAELETFPMDEIRLVVVAPARHLLSRRRAVAFREILEYDLVALPVGSALQDYLDQHAARAGRRLKLRVRLNGFDAVCRMVESGIGVAVIPRTAALRARRSMAVHIVSLTDLWARRHHAICVRNFKSLPAHAQRLVEYLRAPAS